jgi:hypothetical protein
MGSEVEIRPVEDAETETETAQVKSRTISDTLATCRSLVLLQLLTQVLTFILNQSLVRLALSEVFGTAAIRSDLMYSTILFLSIIDPVYSSYDSIRAACLESRHASHRWFARTLQQVRI